MLVRTVFNPIVPCNLDGKDRRVLQLILPNPVTSDELLISSTSPKWTNCDLAALNIIEYLLNRIWSKNLPKNHSGYEPYNLDVEFITKKMNFKEETINETYVEQFQRFLKG